MKIKVLLNIGTSQKDFPPLQEGEHEVSREVGLRLIERGWAVPLEKPAPEVKAVPAATSIKAATEKATADVKTYRERQTRPTESKTTANKEQ